MTSLPGFLECDFTKRVVVVQLVEMCTANVFTFRETILGPLQGYIEVSRVWVSMHS